MKNHIFCFIALLVLPSLYGQLEITFNYDMIEGIQTLRAEDTITDIRFEQLVSSQGTQGFLKKMKSYRPSANEKAFKESLGHLLTESDAPDLFFYSRVKPKFQIGAEFVTNLKTEESKIKRALIESLGDFLPASNQRHITLYFVFGAIGGGWTMDGEPNSFYIDVSSFEKNDAVGLQLLCKHEVLHLIQDQTRPKLSKNEPAAYYIEQAFREGMATYVADFTKVENASGYALFNQKIYNKNQRRKETNYRLFELLVIDLFEQRCDYDFVDDLSLSGMYDSPAYFVFYDMMRTMESKLGTSQVVKLLELSAIDFIRSYEQLEETDYQFSEKFSQVLAKLKH